ncbi:MAG: Holliday junction resolvase RuvX [Acidimicrobiia bacterium]|nr:Holliday junction resolvase RuvX [Acidimicrobiia bacterium]
MTGRVIGLDHGTRRIGVAVSDPTGTIASPVRYIDTEAEDPVEAIEALCVEYDVAVIVLGLPVALDGREGPSAIRVRDFGSRLTERIDLPLEFQDERFTSHTAESVLIEGGVRRSKRKERRDQLAATILLQSWLDRKAYDDGRSSDRPA